jgi:hypothetical protein
MKISAFILGFVVFVPSNAAVPLVEATNPLIESKAEIVVTQDGQHLLRFTIISKLDQSVDIFRSSIPWENLQMFRIDASTAAGEKLPRSLTVGDGYRGTISLKPRTPITGTVTLEKVFPGFERLLQSTDVVLSWNYKLRRVEGSELPRISGKVTSSKSSTSMATTLYSTELSALAQKMATEAKALKKGSKSSATDKN